MRFSPSLRRRLSDIRQRGSFVGPAHEDAALRGAVPSREELEPALVHPGPKGRPERSRSERRRSWIDHPVLVDPPPFTEVATERGPVDVRALSLPLPPEIAEGLPAPAIGPPPALFVDTETLGLGSEPIFLVGMSWVAEGRVHLEQVLARDVSREGALLARWVARARDTGLLISFNGKSYDLPLLADRAARQRLRPPAGTPHTDLLHPARHRWKAEVPDCKLITLEWHLFGRNRQGDIPGREIPGLYRRATRTGDLRLLVPVFHHNALDLLTLVELTPLLAPLVPELGGTRPPRPPRKGRKKKPRDPGATTRTPRGPTTGAPDTTEAPM